MKVLSDLQDFELSKISFDKLLKEFNKKLKRMHKDRISVWKEFLDDPASLEFWYFCAKREDWERNMGSDGYVAVDPNGVIVRTIMLRIN